MQLPRSYRTTQGISTLAVAVALLIWGRSLADINRFSLAFCGLLASFNVGRMLYKKNRGIFREWTGEVLALAISHGWTLYALFHGVDPLLGLGLIIGQQAIFNVCRGLTEGIGVRTQWVFR